VSLRQEVRALQYWSPRRRSLQRQFRGLLSAVGGRSAVLAILAAISVLCMGALQEFDSNFVGPLVGAGAGRPCDAGNSGETPHFSQAGGEASSSLGCKAAALAGFVGVACLGASVRRHSAAGDQRRGSKIFRSLPEQKHGSTAAEPAEPAELSSHHEAVQWHFPPPAQGISPWHDVDLKVQSWLDEDLALFRYVNEIPKGALQKFELQTRMVGNSIREDAGGSEKLQAFGQSVPFNYGCFPQTYRDPLEVDELFHAPGDNDPLDVVEVSDEAIESGRLICCRPLGAACLIDKGRADWKVFVVNVEAKGPLSAARSIEDVERLAPGRVREALRWMDDFKKFSKAKETEMHFEIHDASRAVKLILQDHAAWHRLLAKADASGFAGGHWVRRQGPTPHAEPVALPRVYRPPTCPAPRKVGLQNSFVGASVAPAHATQHALTARQEPGPRRCLAGSIL